MAAARHMACKNACAVGTSATRSRRRRSMSTRGSLCGPLSRGSAYASMCMHAGEETVDAKFRLKASAAAWVE
eukprot:6014460-Pleurochrysis_carterae.AAC.2